MAATDMRKAGLEIGALVDLPDDRTGFIIWIDERAMSDDCRPYKVEINQLGCAATFYADEIIRDYDEAQSARHVRFAKLLDRFPGDAGVPEETDTIERYVLVQSNEQDGAHAFVWGDTREDAFEYAGGEILDGWMPLGIFDLDTGIKHDLHISSPVIAVSEDSPCTVNELSDVEMAENEEFVKARYELVGWTVTASIAVENTPGSILPGQIQEFILGMAGYNGVENVSANIEEIRQLRPEVK